MSNKKPAAKGSIRKAEPAAEKDTTAPAPRPKVSKKKDTKPPKDTATPAPVPDVELQTRLEELEQSNAELKSEYVELANRNEKLQQDLATKKTNATTAKLETSRVKTLLDENIAYAAKLEKKVEALTNEALTNTRGWINRGNKWVFAAVPVIILGVWIFFLNRHNNNLEKTVQDKNTVIESKDRQIQNLKDEVNYDTTHAANNDIQVPDAAESKKKILTGNG